MKYRDIKNKFHSGSGSLDVKVDDAISSLKELIRSENCKALEPYIFLFLCYLQKNRIVEACFLVAEYNIPCDFSPVFYDVPEELKNWFEGCPKTYEDHLIRAILEDDDIYDRVS